LDYIIKHVGCDLDARSRPQLHDWITLLLHGRLNILTIQ